VRESRGLRIVRLRQEFHGVPVLGAAIVVQIGKDGGVEFLLSDVARDRARMHSREFQIEPTVWEGVAQGMALSAAEEASGAPDLEIRQPRLMIYEPSILGNAGASRLVWFINVRSETTAVDEVVLVDAISGEVAFHYSRVRNARNRDVYDCEEVPDSLGTLVRSEGQSATGNSDVDLAYDYLGDTYDFYASEVGRDSIDDLGMTLVARVRYCPSGSCPDYENAFWNGSEMRFGTGYASADDVVGHELTHGVTQHGADLIYWGESGAIDESLSDIFGELVDLTNGAGDDTPEVRWLLGEDLPIGPTRNMQDPTVAYPPYSPSSPDRRFSEHWWNLWSDNRGVHVNSGVGNKLAYLLTDGGTFNGETITGQGISAVAGLFYEAQQNLLVPASDYADLFLVLRRAALNVGWSVAARRELDEASRAVEIDVPPAEVVLFSDGFEGPFPGAWTVYDVSEVGAQWGPATHYKATGTRSAWCAGGGANASTDSPGSPYKPGMTTWLVYGPFSLAGTTQAWAEFDLVADVEDGYDYAFWGVSVDGVNFSGWQLSPPETDGLVVGPEFFVHEKFDYRDLAGESEVWLAFLFSSDSSIQYEGVFVDNVTLHKAGGEAPFGSFDTPEDGSVGVTGNVAVTGWALDDGGVERVEIYRDPMAGETPGPNGKVFIGNTNFVPGARPDIDAAFSEYPISWRAGWGYMLLTNYLPNSGKGTFTLHAYASDEGGETTLLGSKAISCDNANAVKPFGTIDTPGQGETVSGIITNFGWALTPQPGTIPTDGSTILVYIDGVPVGNPVYNQYRADIAALFPGYSNSDGAVGYFVIDTTTLANGIHSIAWSVTDDLGQVDGIGSRFFWVDN
jgi:Zn-dependent metalloprotease